MLDARRKIKLNVKKIKRLKWGAAGCGKFMETSFLPALQQLKRSSLFSVYSSDINRAKFISNKFNANYYYNDFETFLQSDIDCVYISGKNSDHHWQVIAAAKAGKHILCEKPLALNFEQAEEMVRICKENGVLLTINYVYRFHPLVQKTKELIDKNTIGKIISISANFNVNLPPDDNYRFQKEHGGGALRDLGTHMIDLLRFFGGEITEIKGFVGNVVYKTEVDDSASGLVRFEKNGFGDFNVSFNAQKQFNRVEILGHNGCLSIDNMVGRRNASSKLTIELTKEAKKSFRKRVNKQLLLLKSVQNSFLFNYPLGVTAEDGLLNMRIIEELEKSCTP